MSPVRIYEPCLYKITLRDSTVDVIAVSHADALKAWRAEVEHHPAIDYEDDNEPDSVVAEPNGSWVAISPAAWKSYKAKLARMRSDGAQR